MRFIYTIFTRQEFIGYSVLKKTIFHFAILMFIFGQNGLAQTTGSPQYIAVELKKGSTIKGILIADTTDKIVLKNATLGEVTLPKTTVKYYRKIHRSTINEDWNESIGSCKNILMPNGYGLRKSQIYYQHFMGAWGQFNIGITDHFSVGVGLELVTPVTFLLDNPVRDYSINELPGYVFNPKVSIPIIENKWNFGIGGIALNAPFLLNPVDGALIYGVNTIGSRDRNVSLGFGYGVLGKGFYEGYHFSIGGNYRINKNIAVTTENIVVLLFNPVMVNMVGIRYIGERATWDLGFIGFGGSLDDDDATDFPYQGPIPLISVMYPFLNKKK